MTERVTVFVSYSHRDAPWLARLQVHLRPLGSRLDLWDDTRLTAGDDWRAQISNAIGRARVAVLLVSADFLASDFVAREELPPLLEKARAEGALIIPVILKPCRFERHLELAAFQAANPLSAPLSGMPETESERVFVRVAERIDQALAGGGDEAPPVPPQHPGARPESELFASLRGATLCLHVLVHLAGEEARSGRTVTDLFTTLGATSRRHLMEVLLELQEEGWIERERQGRRTIWKITPQGVHQTARLAALTRVPLKLARPGPEGRSTRV